MEWSGRAPAPPASEAGTGRQRQGAQLARLEPRGRSPRVLSMCADRARDRHSDLAAVPERVAIWSQRNVSGVGMSRRISTCMTAPTISRRRTWLARNDSSVSCVGTSRSLAAMALRVSLSRSTKWRRDDEPLEPQARCPSRIPSRTRVEGNPSGPTMSCNCRSKRARRALRFFE